LNDRNHPTTRIAPNPAKTVSGMPKSQTNNQGLITVASANINTNPSKTRFSFLTTFSISFDDIQKS
jgi:hypothetical protein